MEKEVKIFKIIIILDILLLMICTFSYVKPSSKLQQIPSKNITHKILMPKTNKITIKNINKSVVSNKTIYLTFDDGPSYLTESILNILKAENVPATFFVTANKIDEYQNIIRREYEENHTVAVHSATHVYSYIYSSDQNYFNDLTEIRNKVFKIIGIKPRIIRLPGGSSNTISKKYSPGIITRITNNLNSNNFYYYDWNIDSTDASGYVSKDQIYNSVITHLKSGTNIILMHDSATKKTTVEALQSIIEYGKQNGYTFAKITKNTPQIHHHINN